MNTIPLANVMALKAIIIRHLISGIDEAASSGEMAYIGNTLDAIAGMPREIVRCLDSRFLRDEIRPVFSKYGYSVEFHHDPYAVYPDLTWYIAVDLSGAVYNRSNCGPLRNTSFRSKNFDAIYRPDYVLEARREPRGFNGNGRILSRFKYTKCLDVNIDF